MREVKFLMVDDHEDDSILFREMLDDSGFVGGVVSVGGANEAWEYLEGLRRNGLQEEVGIIFLDLNMPMKNGFEFLDELMSDFDFKKIPVIMVSGSRRESEKEGALLKGAIAYISKPITFEHIVTAIQGLSMKWSLS